MLKIVSAHVEPSGRSTNASTLTTVSTVSVSGSRRNRATNVRSVTVVYGSRAPMDANHDARPAGIPIQLIGLPPFVRCRTPHAGVEDPGVSGGDVLDRT